MRIDESIPVALRSPVEAAVAWINEIQGRAFELTGLVAGGGVCPGSATVPARARRRSGRSP